MQQTPGTRFGPEIFYYKIVSGFNAYEKKKERPAKNCRFKF